jgi:gamma-glutamylcyclotransferase (GGCT)/AIG2-like uncharacterized protein YtfP
MNLFAYGTLMDPEIMAQVSGSVCRSETATLHQYVRKKVRGEVYPAIIEQQGSSVDGVVYFDVSEAACERLDTFEGSLYVRTETAVICNNGECVKAYAYVIKAGHGHQLSGADWNYEKFLANHKQLFQVAYSGYDKLI